MRKVVLWFSLIGWGWAQPLHLVFEVSETVTPEKGKPKVTSYPLEVGLGLRHLHCADRREKVWMDFDRARVTELSGKDSSLYSLVGFRWAESRNRWRLGGALSAAGIKEGAGLFDPVLTEHRFSMTDPEAKARPKVEGLRATYQGKTLLEGQGTGLALSEQQASAYARFLRYQFGGHPLALNELAKARQIPQTLKLVFADQPRKVSFVVTLKSHESAAEPAAPNARYTPGRGLEALAHKACTVRDQTDHSRKVQQRASEALKKGQALTAVLLFLGDSLATGDQSGAGLREHRDKFQNDPQCKILFANLSGKDEAASKKLKGLEKAAGSAVHLLRIFEAGVMSARRQPARAMKLYQEALTTDPYITGAWIDLGNMHFEAFECEQAWQCWDAARHLTPDHKSLEQVTGLEQMLRKEYPDFF